MVPTLSGEPPVGTWPMPGAWHVLCGWLFPLPSLREELEGEAASFIQGRTDLIWHLLQGGQEVRELVQGHRS